MTKSSLPSTRSGDGLEEEDDGVGEDGRRAHGDLDVLGIGVAAARGGWHIEEY